MLEARFVADDWDDPRLYYVEVDSESVEEWKEILSEEYREHVARYGVEIPEFIRDRHWSCTRPKLVKIEVMPPLVDVDA